MEGFKKVLYGDFIDKVRSGDCKEDYLSDLLALWDSYCQDKSLPELPYRYYKLFSVDGNRSIYEKPYFDRRRILTFSCVLSLLYPEKPEYFEKLQDMIFEVCNEYTWCLPAHQLPIEVLDPGKVDLFASETAFILAEIYTLMADRLEPLILRRIEYEIKRRVIDTTLNRVDGWHWEDSAANWSAVCWGSIGCAAMLMFPQEFEQLKPRIDRSMEIYLSGFLGEGVCTEGCTYWQYGFGFFTIYADMLEKYTDGKENYFLREDVRKIATFMQKMYLGGNTIVSFSDSVRNFSVHLAFMHYYKDKYGDDIKLPAPDLFCSAFVGEAKLSHAIRNATWYNKNYANTNEIDNANDYYYFEKTQWYVNKRCQFAFASKGGNNKEPHNHNDIGTFIIAKEGRQVFADLGGGKYSRSYFSSERYTLFEPSSYSHCLPIIDGEGQLFGEYHARDVESSCDRFTLNVAHGYRAGLMESILRQFDIRDDGVKLTDSFIYGEAKQITERFITLAEPKLEAPGRVIVDGICFSFSPALDCKIEQVVTEKHSCYTIDIALPEKAESFTAEFNVCK